MLVDTHVLIWFTEGDGRIGPRTRERLATQHPVWFSAVSILEIAIERLKSGLDLPENLTQTYEAAGFRHLPLIGEHAEQIVAFPALEGHDPFDRALVAQASSEGIELLTADRHLLALGIDWIVDACA